MALESADRASHSARVLIFAAIGAALGVFWKISASPHAYVMFKGYITGFGLILLYRMLARAPGFRRVLRPTRVTREGVYFLVLTLVFGAASLYTGDNLLHLIVALLLSLLLVSGATSGACLAGVSVQRRAPALMPAGVPMRLELMLWNRKWFIPSLAIGIEESPAAPGETEPAERFAFATWIAPRGKRLAQYSLTPMTRGPLDFGDVRLTCRFPFGLFERDRLLVIRQRVWVMPRIHPIQSDAPMSALDPVSTPARRPRGMGGGEDVIGLRDYRPGDPIRQIHWPTTARRGAPVIREYAPPDVHRVTLLIDSWIGDLGTRTDAVEAVLRLAASLMFALHRQGRPVTMLLPGRTALTVARPQAFRDAMEQLAREHNVDRPAARSISAATLPPGRLVVLCATRDAATRQLLMRLPRARAAQVIHADEEAQWLEPDRALDPADVELLGARRSLHPSALIADSQRRPTREIVDAI